LWAYLHICIILYIMMRL